MPSVRALSATVVIAALSMPLTACSEAAANDMLAQLQAVVNSLQRQSQRDFRSDPFNSEFERDTNFRNRWPSGVPMPRGGTAPDWVANPDSDDPSMGSNWGDSSSGEAEAYGESLEEAGFERTSQTTETDAATGREETTTTYRNEDGTEVVVYQRTGANGDRLHVVTRPGS